MAQIAACSRKMHAAASCTSSAEDRGLIHAVVLRLTANASRRSINFFVFNTSDVLGERPEQARISDEARSLPPCTALKHHRLLCMPYSRTASVLFNQCLC